MAPNQRQCAGLFQKRNYGVTLGSVPPAVHQKKKRNVFISLCIFLAV